MSHAASRESPFVSFTELLTGAFLIMVLLILALALNQRDNISSVRDTEREIQQMRERRYKVALEVVKTQAGKQLAEKMLKEVQAKLSSQKIELKELKEQRSTVESLLRQEMEESIKRYERLELKLGEQIRKIGSQQKILAALATDIEAATERYVKIETEITEKQTRLQTQRRRIGELDLALLRLKSERDRHTTALSQPPGRTTSELQFLEVMRTELNKEGISVDIDRSSLVFPADVLFDLGSAKIVSRKQERVVAALARTLEAATRCYWDQTIANSCDRARRLSAIFIEGHADTSGPQPDNLRLSVDRALEVYRKITSYRPNLGRLRSKSNKAGGGQTGTLLAIAGFGESRPRVVTTDGVKEPKNRRIELRFVYDE